MTERLIAGDSRVIGDPATRLIDHGGPDDGPLVLLLHGFGGSALNWQLVGPALAARHRVVAIDLLGHGRSAAPRDLRAAAVAEQVGRVIDAELAGRPRPVILVAGSFGSTIAFMVAGMRPDVVGVAAVDGALPVHPERRLDVAMTLKRWLISLPGVSGLIFKKTSTMSPREFVEQMLSDAGVDARSLDPALMRVSVELEEFRHLDRAAHEAQQRLLRDLLRIFARGREFTAMVAGVRAPVLWLHSDDDPLIPFDLAERFVADRPRWRLAHRPGLGHVPMMADPDWVVAEVLAWVAETARG